MPDRSHQSNALPAVLIALAFIVLLLLAMMTTAVTAQDTPTQEPTSEFDLNGLQIPTSNATFNPQDLPSLTGVNGHAVNAAVIIRSGPGIGYTRIGSLRKDGWIDIIGWNGWNGWKDGRDCSSTFADDLDMWVQVQFGERRGWVARCILTITGKISNLPIVSATGERDLQR